MMRRFYKSCRGGSRLSLSSQAFGNCISNTQYLIKGHKNSLNERGKRDSERERERERERKVELGDVDEKKAK